MLAAVKGRVQGNTVLIDEDIRAYDGTEVIVTLLDYPQKTVRKAPLEEMYRPPKVRPRNLTIGGRYFYG